jgi:hypothetical protein
MALGRITLKSGDRISVLRSSPFFAVHSACLAAFFLKFHWSYLDVCLALYYERMFFLTAGYTLKCPESNQCATTGNPVAKVNVGHPPYPNSGDDADG